LKRDRKKEGSIIRKGELDPGAKIDWVPDTTYDHADFALPETKRGMDRAAETKKKADPAEPVERASVASWIPPNLATGGKITPPAEARGEKISSGQIIKNRPPAEKSPPQSQYENIVSVRLLREIIRAYPENSMYILRNWYFEKPDARGVHPHQKIRVVLESAGMEILQFLFRMLSPVERRSMAEILKGPRLSDEKASDEFRREFMEKVKNYV
jgi:hypothetical protein